MKFYIITYLFLYYTFILFAQNQEYQQKFEELYRDIERYGISNDWLKENLDNKNFLIYQEIPKLFSNMAENRVKKSELTLQDYMNNFDIASKVKRGLEFIKDNNDLLNKVESRNGIHKELIISILAIETNFGSKKYFGNFYLFPTLVTVYFNARKSKFALRELQYLYLLKLFRAIDYSYIKGSFAGAVGLGQFIPSSIFNFFVDTDMNDDDLDIFAMDDNIASIENYLFKHGLNSKTMDDLDKVYYAVFAYNRSDAYVKAILEIYNKLCNR